MVNQVRFNSRKLSPKQQQHPSGKKEKSAKTRTRCPKCGGFTHREGQACRAEGKRCNLCSKTGHFANSCPDKQAKTAKVKAVSELDEEIGFLLGVSAVEDSSNLDDDESECRRRWTAEIQVNGKQVKFKLDSQADVTCVPLCLFKTIMGQQRLVESNIGLRAAEFSELQTVGMFVSTLRNGSYEIKERIKVIRRLSEPLLSRRACELLNLARRIEVVATKIDPIKEYPKPIAWTPGVSHELLMGSGLRTTLPIAPEDLSPGLVDSRTLKRREERRRRDMKSRYDRRCGAGDMEELVKNEKTPAVDYPSGDSDDGQIRTRSGRIVKPVDRLHSEQTGNSHNEKAANCLIAKNQEKSEQEWIIDCGATSHMTSCFELLKNSENKERKIILADETQIESKAIGNVKIKTKEENLLILKDVLFVPQIKGNLLSVGKLVQDYQRIIFSKDKCTIIDF
ncbi:hypothetical protein LAZ67_5002935 [Cordylochernes scorpioides]|uniref:CCHC-type domain-containing protein n=1 Tax=Cordylochernes scorpioides TaxID=51811 RepID=A0ABY6KH35_9ARAC|nr:hypothetical protein LAZ67_5002935 [Cordylochernes scorpioides]